MDKRGQMKRSKINRHFKSTRVGMVQTSKRRNCSWGIYLRNYSDQTIARVNLAYSVSAMIYGFELERNSVSRLRTISTAPARSFEKSAVIVKNFIQVEMKIA